MGRQLPLGVSLMDAPYSGSTEINRISGRVRLRLACRAMATVSPTTS